MLLGDPARVNTDLARLQAVTAADIQRVMKKYFTDSNRLVLYYRLGVKASTIATLVGRIFDKLGVNNRPSAVAMAIRYGLCD